MSAEQLLDLLAELVAVKVAEKLAAAKPAPAVGLVTIKAYADARSISPSMVRAAIKSRRLPAVRIGSAWRVAADAVVGEPIVVEKAKRESPDAFALRLLGGGR